jgi:peptidyl-prolyl cis-trans isomerase C
MILNMNQNPANAGQVVASVGGQVITEADVERFYASLGQRGQALRNPEGRNRIIEQLVNQKLMLLDAARNLYEREPVFKEQLSHLKDELLVNYAISKVVDGVQVSDADAKAFYDANPEQFVGEETVNASHILVDSEEKALAIKAEIDAGTVSFADAAKANSSCPSSEQGGNLGDFGRGQMVPEFDQACFTMEVGTVSEPVKTQFGYHLILVNSRTEGETMAFDAIKDQLKQKLLADKQQAAYQSKINQLKILYPVEMF